MLRRTDKFRRINMTSQKAIKYCLTKNGSYVDYPFGLDVTIIKVKGKIFAQFFMLNEKNMATFNCDKLMGELYRKLYPNIVVRGYHCPPVQQPYFNTLPMDSTISDDVIVEMINHSYAYVVSKLPKYVQKELAEK